jgi:hypothetical protein
LLLEYVNGFVAETVFPFTSVSTGTSCNVAEKAMPAIFGETEMKAGVVGGDR